VSAPRTFDAYAEGDPTRPLDGETDGPGRVEDVTGGRFQGLCPDVSHLPPAQAQQAVNHAMNNLYTQLLNGGHGSFAFVVTAWEGGSAHAWAAINQNGTILFVDPQSGRISENVPLYGHYGQSYEGNVVMMDALVLDANANPMPLPNHPPGAWTTRPPITQAGPTPTPAPTPSPSPTPQPGPQPGPTAQPSLTMATDTGPFAVTPTVGVDATPPAPGSAPPPGTSPDDQPSPADDTDPATPATAGVEPSQQGRPIDPAPTTGTGPVNTTPVGGDPGPQASATPVSDPPPGTTVDSQPSPEEGTASATQPATGVTPQQQTQARPADPVPTDDVDAHTAAPVGPVEAGHSQPAPVAAREPQQTVPSADDGQGPETAGTPETSSEQAAADTTPSETRPSRTPEQIRIAETAAEVIRATTGWGGPTDPNPVANEAGPYDISPDEAADVLDELPQSQLLAHRPLPVLDGRGPRVERDESGLITRVEYGRWMAADEFVDRLTAERAQAWRVDADDRQVPQIRRSMAGPCISVALDRRTGLMAEGHNRLRLEEDQLHPLLRERLERYRALCAALPEPFEWDSHQLHPSEPGTHAELYAVNELLWAREAAGLAVDVDTLRELHVDNEFPWMGGGQSAPCCGNCTAVIPDVESSAGKLPYFDAPEEERWRR
jgi:hypothetical protein